MILHPESPLPYADRIWVLVPDAELDELAFAKHLWDLVQGRAVLIMFMGQVADISHEARARRRLANLAAITRDETVHVEMHLTFEREWEQVLPSLVRRQEVVICPSELRRRDGTPVSEVLASNLRAPIYLLPGFYPQNAAKKINSLRRILRLAVPATIVLSFLGVQLPVDRLTTGWAHMLLLSISVVFEYLLLLGWITADNNS